MKDIATQIKALQEKQETLDSKIRNAIVKEANALLKRMGADKEYSYSELCNACVTASIDKKEIYSLSDEALAFRTVSRYAYIYALKIKRWDIDSELNKIEKLIKGE